MQQVLELGRKEHSTRTETSLVGLLSSNFWIGCSYLASLAQDLEQLVLTEPQHTIPNTSMQEQGWIWRGSSSAHLCCTRSKNINTAELEVHSTLPATEVDPSTARQPSRERELQLPELDRQGRLLGPARGEALL